MMKHTTLAGCLWGKSAKISYLFIAAVLLLFACLGGKEIWTQEHRWADIVAGMFYRHDFFHPYLGTTDYYDKPLLSYWLIAALVKLRGAFTTWDLRIPSAFAGLIAIFSMFSLGKQLRGKELGFLAAWLLLTTYYFVFWARTSSADMLNVAGSLLAVAWYIKKRHSTRIFDYSVFFIIIALTSLCKGLIGAVVPLIAVFVDMCLQGSLRKHLNVRLFLSIIPGIILYLIPFFASAYFDTNNNYGVNGLYLVYRENIIRYFHPFDHQDPIYTYFVYLPIYTLPWAVLLIPALITLPKRFSRLDLNSKWICYTLLALFAFFTLSGSRRSYYVLPMVPFAILFIADWLQTSGFMNKWQRSLASCITLFYCLLLSIIFLQNLYYANYGINRFADIVKAKAQKQQPWDKWQVVLLDAETKVSFYLQLPPDLKNYNVRGARQAQTSITLLQFWPVLKQKTPNTIYITRKLYEPLLLPFFKHYRVIEIKMNANLEKWLHHDNSSEPIAFIPEK